MVRGVKPSVEETTVACPACSAPGKVTLHSTIQVATEPDLKDALLAGKLSVFTCEKCGQRARIAHPMLYADNARNFFVQLDPEGTIDLGSIEKKPRLSRRVRESNSLIEKIRIEDAGLDDRVIELWKLLLGDVDLQYTGMPWFFERIEGDSIHFTLVTPKGPLATKRPRAEYDKLAAEMKERGALLIDEAFATIDRTYAAKLMSGE